MPEQSKDGAVTRGFFREWLRNSTGPLCLKDGSTQHILTRFPKTDDLEYLFEQTSYHGSGVSWNNKFEFFGIHDRRSQVLYTAWNGLLPKVVEGLEPGDTVSIDNLRESFQAEVNRLVEEKIGNDRNNLTIRSLDSDMARRDLSSYRQYGAHEDAVRRFFEGHDTSSVRFQSWYRMDYWNEDALLGYLKDPAAYSQAEADRYIAKNQEEFLKQFQENDLLLKQLREIEADPDCPIQKMKRITDAVSGSQAKSVTVTIQKDGKELTFKTSADSLKGHKNYYSTWQLPAQDRRRFEEMFGRSADYNAEDITRITYGRNTIYEAAPTEPIQAEEPAQGMTMGGMM